MNIFSTDLVSQCVIFNLVCGPHILKVPWLIGVIVNNDCHLDDNKITIKMNNWGNL